MKKIDFAKYEFHSVIALPPDYEVYDFSKSYESDRPLRSPYGVGKYNEKRVGMYTSELFAEPKNTFRDIHVGVDIAAPVGTPITSFYDGDIFLFGYNDTPFDYGNTLVTHHIFDGIHLYTLYGHLSSRSLSGKSKNQKIKKGEVIAWIGDKSENGGWNPHLHFQLSYLRPDKPDLPGVVCEADRDRALKSFPDPRLVLGPLYKD